MKLVSKKTFAPPLDSAMLRCSRCGGHHEVDSSAPPYHPLPVFSPPHEARLFGACREGRLEAFRLSSLPHLLKSLCNEGHGLPGRKATPLPKPTLTNIEPLKLILPPFPQNFLSFQI